MSTMHCGDGFLRINIALWYILCGISISITLAGEYERDASAIHRSHTVDSAITCILFLVPIAGFGARLGLRLECCPMEACKVVLRQSPTSQDCCENKTEAGRTTL